MRTSRRSVLIPKVVTALSDYDRTQFARDLTAGVIVGIVALPLAIAFAIASGVSPERGLYTAIIAGFIISALGGSRVQIGGPTGAFVVIVYGIVQKFGLDGLTVATLMAGVILVVIGAVRLGSVIKFIPQPVVIGFTSGIAVIIFSSEVKDFLGLRMGALPAEFLPKWQQILAHLPTASAYALGISLFSLAFMLLWPRVSRRVPGPFVALILATVAAQLLHWPVETIGSRFGGISAGFPRPVLPHVSLAQATALVVPAFTIAMLGAVESLLSAVVSDVKNGGRTPVAGMVHAVTLLLITLFFGRWAALIPLASLAAILVLVAYNMSEWRAFRAELRAPKSDIAVLLATFFLTI